MKYLALKRSQRILAGFTLASLLLVAFPGIDLAVSTFFYRTNGFGQDGVWQSVVRGGLIQLQYALMAGVVLVYALNRLTRRNVLRVDGRTVAYLFAVLILGLGLIVNLAFKEGVGRARPRDLTEFGGARTFTPAFVVAGQCRTNCSFSSGDVAAASFTIALVMALRRRRSLPISGLAAAALMSLARMSTGAHFLSDAVVSFFVIWIVSDALYYYLLLSSNERDGVEQQESAYVQPTQYI